MIKAIIFDCFGVLTADSWREFVDSIKDPAIADEARRLNRAYDAQSISLDDYLNQVEKITGHPKEQLQLLINNQDSDRGKNMALLHFIGTLKPKYKIGLISNIGSDWIRQEFLTSEEQKLFDDMVLSFEVGLTKPDRRIFKLACNRLGVDLNEAVFIDDVSSYCEVAKSLGMQAITYENLLQMKTELQKLLRAS